MKGCLLLFGAIASGFLLGQLVRAVLTAITGDDDLSTAIGTGVWLLSTMTVLPYGSLWFSDPEEIMERPPSTSTIQQWRDAKAESKLQGAELRMGFVFAMLGGATAAMAGAPKWVTAIATIFCAALGGLMGYDIKRRVQRIREQFNKQTNPEVAGGPDDFPQ